MTTLAAAKDREYCISMRYEMQTDQEHPETT